MNGGYTVPPFFGKLLIKFNNFLIWLFYFLVLLQLESMMSVLVLSPQMGNGQCQLRDHIAVL